jgi:hypothetical protein
MFPSSNLMNKWRLKGLSIEKFYGIIEYNEEEIDNWLVDIL